MYKNLILHIPNNDLLKKIEVYIFVVKLTHTVLVLESFINFYI